MDSEQMLRVGDDHPSDIELHLRAVIEHEPIPLARVARDGTLLAVNDAGLPLLGAESLDQILGRSLPDLAAPEQRDSLHSFLVTAADGDRGSFEADLVGLTGTPHAVDIRANRYPGSLDGIPSALLAFHDIGKRRSLERSLEAALLRAEEGAAHEAECIRLRAELALTLADREADTNLQDELDAAHQERAALVQRFDDEKSGLCESLAAERRRAEALQADLASAPSREPLDDLQKQLDQIHEERQHLRDDAARLWSEVQAERNIVTEQASRLQALEAAQSQSAELTLTLLAAIDEREAQSREHSSRAELLDTARQQAVASSDELRRALDSRELEIGDLRARVQQLEAERACQADGIEAARTAHETRETERAATESSLQALRGALDDATEERNKLAALVTAAEQRTAEVTARLQDADQLWSARIAEVDAARSAMGTRLAELEAVHATRIVDVQAEHAAQVCVLEQALADQRAAHERRVAELEEAAAAKVGWTPATDAAVLVVRMAELEAAHSSQVSELAVSHAQRVAALGRSLAEQQLAHDSLVKELKESAAVRLAEAESTHAALLAETERAYGERCSALDAIQASQAAQVVKLETDHAAATAELQATHEARLHEARLVVAEAIARAATLEERIQRVESAFAIERQQREDTLRSAVDSDREARQALALSLAARAAVERSRTSLLDAISRLARDARCIEESETAAGPASAAEEERRSD